MVKKTKKTIKETRSGKNIETIDLKNLSKKKNTELIKKAKAGKLPGYHVVEPKGKEPHLRSNPDRKKKNNLDPKLKR